MLVDLVLLEADPFVLLLDRCTGADLAEGAGASHVVATRLPPGVATPGTASDCAIRIRARFSGRVSISQDLESE